MNYRPLETIKAELAPLQAFDIVLYGSYVEHTTRPHSDIDIALISHSFDEDQNFRLWQRLIIQIPSKYDFRIFELLPLPVQMGLIQNYSVLFGDKLEISEYFYQVRKRWDDCRYRYLENLT